MPMFNYIPHFGMVGILFFFIRDLVFRIQSAQRLPVGENSPINRMGVVSSIIINYKQHSCRKVRSTLTLSDL